jgi:hypothetical protein
VLSKLITVDQKRALLKFRRRFTPNNPVWDRNP